MKHFFLLVLIALWSNIILAQGTFQPKQMNNMPKGVIYSKENTFDARIHTHGFAMGLTFGKINSFYKSSFYQFELGSLKHPKEIKQNFEYQITGTAYGSRSFVYGKRNHLLVARAAIGRKRFLTEKAKKRGLSIGYTYSVGANLGLLKPYYLELLKIDNNGERYLSTEKYSDENATLFLDETNIFGAANFFKGIKETSIVPGANAKVAAHFDWGAFDEFIKAMEVGLMLDVFIKKVPIMVENNDITNSENRPFFINVFISFQLGKRTY